MSQRTHMVDQDTEGLRIAFRELLEEGFAQAKVERMPSRVGEARSPEEAKRLRELEAERREQQLKAVTGRRTLSVGYYSFAGHIFRLDAERNAGLALDPARLAHFEGAALRTLAVARNEYRWEHPHCPACGIEQATRFHPTCTDCGAKFNRKGAQ